MRILSKEETQKLRDLFISKFKPEKPEDVLKRILPKEQYELAKKRNIPFGIWLSNYFDNKYEDELFIKWASDESRAKSLKEVSRILGNYSKNIIAFALPEEQVGHFKKTFTEKYNECALEITPSEINQIAQDFIQLYLTNKKLSFMITLDNDGNIRLAGSKLFIECFKNLKAPK